MDRCSKLVAVLLFAFAGSTHAYLSPSPPPGFGGTPGSWTHSPPSSTQQIDKIMRGPGPKIPGGPVTNGAFRLGPGAARALAGGAARFLIPGLGAALAIGWLASNCFEHQGGRWVRTCFADQQISDGYEYRSGHTTVETWRPTPQGACDDYLAYIRGLFPSRNATLVRCPAYGTGLTIRVDAPQNGVSDYFEAPLVRKTSTCPAGWYRTPAGCVQTPQPQPVTVEQIEEEMAPKPLPQTLPPGFPYPLDPAAPFIFEPDTANPPNAQPLRIPQGNPVPVPNTNPQQYRQPVTRFTSSPTADDPFRLDARPEEIVGTSPTGITGPQPVTSGAPAGEKPEQFDLCKEHPDIIACQVFKPDELTEKPLVNKEVPLALNAAGGFPSGGSCPQAKVMQLMGQTFSFSMQPLCDFALGIKPLLIGFAWLSAALVFLGVARREN